MTTLFSEDWSTLDFSKWASVNADGVNGIASVVPSPITSGKNAGRFWQNGNGSASATLLVLGGSGWGGGYPLVYVETTILFDEIPNPGWSITPLMLRGPSGMWTSVSILNDAGVLRFVVNTQVNGAENISGVAAMSLAVNVPYKLALTVRSEPGTGEVRLSINGVEEVVLSGLTNDIGAVDTLIVGNNLIGYSAPLAVYVGDVALTDTPPGTPPPPPETRMIRANSNPQGMSFTLLKVR